MERAEGAGGDAGHAHHALARDGDEGLRGLDGQALHRVAAERAPGGHLGARSFGTQEGPHVELHPASVERDESARMQDLGPEVRDLRRLAVVELRDEPRIRDVGGVRGEDAGQLLPQDHARGAEDAAEKGRRQVRAAAAQRGDGPVGGAAEEARDDRRNALSQERRGGPFAHAGGFRSGPGPPRHDGRRWTTTSSASTLAAARPATESVAATIAAATRSPRETRTSLVRGERWPRAASARQISRYSRAARLASDRRRRRSGPGADQVQDERAVPAQERGRLGAGRGHVSASGAMGAFEQPIGDALESGDDDDQVAGVPPYEPDGPAHGVGVGERRPAELPDLEPRPRGRRLLGVALRPARPRQARDRSPPKPPGAHSFTPTLICPSKGTHPSTQVR